MFVVEYDGLELDHCPACAGTWFDADELGLLFADGEDNPHPELVGEVVAGRPDAETGEKRRRCPQCRRHMRKVNIGPSGRVLVDACPSGHGLYFDHGEVADLTSDLYADSTNPPGRVLAFLGGLLGRAPAAGDTEES
jgi:Zn-finger nucleic acid-binding protein